MSEATNTKIELVAEAIETLVLSVVASATNKIDSERLLHHENVVDARKTVADALRIAFTPTLRIVDSIPAPDARPAYPAA